MTDVLVIGAGPAGSAAARLLAEWGRRVVLVHRAGGDQERLGESIPPSAQKVLAAIGVLSVVEDAGFLRWRGNTVWWGTAGPRVETFTGGMAGYQVPRARFDACLRAASVAAGASFVAGLVRDVRLPSLGDTTGDGQPRVEIESEGGPQVFAPRIVIDASGRAGVVARRALRVTDGPTRTIALAGVWRCDSTWGLRDDSHTLVASYEDGWAWSVPVTQDERLFTVMIDPLCTVRRRDAPAREVYEAELSKVRPFAAILGHGLLSGEPWGADATPYHASRYAGPDFLLAGDAGSFIDPLSSFGVKKALASGWLAAIVANTLLSAPDRATAACEFFERRERAMVRFAAAQSARLAGDIAAGGAAHPFWFSRAEREGSEDDALGGPDPASLAGDPAVRAAFDDLRTRPRIHLRRSPDVSLCRCPLVHGREIVLEDHLILPDWSDGVRYLRNVDLVDLLELAPAHHDVGALCEAFVMRHPRAALPDILGALSVLIARRQLLHADVVA